MNSIKEANQDDVVQRVKNVREMYEEETTPFTIFIDWYENDCDATLKQKIRDYVGLDIEQEKLNKMWSDEDGID